MNTLLFEIYSEEIPSLLQQNAIQEFEKYFYETAKEFGLELEYNKNSRFIITPNRMAVLFSNFPTHTQSSLVSAKGPKLGKVPEHVIEKFAQSHNLSISNLEIESTPKGDYYMANYTIPNKKTEEILNEFLSAIIFKLSWKKSMRWHSQSEYWIRPIRNIFCMLNNKIQNISIMGINSSDFSAIRNGKHTVDLEISDAKDYISILENHDIYEYDIKKKNLLNQIQDITKKHNLEAKYSTTLLEDILGSVNNPNAQLVTFDEEFLSLGSEIISLTIEKNQKCIICYDSNGEITNQIIYVVNNFVNSNKLPSILAGNKKVITARLVDAKFFLHHDSQTLLKDRHDCLRSIIFSDQLGTIYDKTIRVAGICQKLSTDLKMLQEIDWSLLSQLYKSDLSTNLVNEFPALQGYAGERYALEEGYEREIARAIREHYFPIGANGMLPTKNSPGIILSLADRIDTVMSLFYVNKMPTGSGDPYALRRAVIAIIRIIHEYELPDSFLNNTYLLNLIESLSDIFPNLDNANNAVSNLRNFFLDRIRYYLKTSCDSNVIAIFSMDNYSSILTLIKNIEYVQKLVMSKNKEFIYVCSIYKRAKFFHEEFQKAGLTTLVTSSGELINQAWLNDIYINAKEIESMIDNHRMDDEISKQNTSIATNLKDFCEKFGLSGRIDVLYEVR